MLKPLNRHILIDLDQRTDEQKSLIVLPEDYKPEQEKHSVVQVINKSEDVKLDLLTGSKIVVDSSMIEEIVVNNTTYNVILENYVVGVLTPE
jgi:co-chaperonin GroES (HSP10)